MAKKKLTIDDVLVPKEEIPYEVPKNWCWVKLGSIVLETSSGFACSKRYEVSEDDEQAYPHLRPNNIGYYGKLNLDKVVYIPKDKVDAKKSILQKGTILFNNTNSTELVGRSILIEEDMDYAFSNHITRVAVNKEICSPEWLNYAINYNWVQGLFARICKQWVGQSGVNQDVLNKEVYVPIPPLAEQVRIVNRIESLFDKIDMASSLVDKARDGFELRKTSILEKGFKGEVIGKKYTDLVNLGEVLTEISSGFACGKQNEISKEDDGAYPHFRPNNVGFYNQFNYDKIVYIPEEKVQKCKGIINKGDIIFNNTNSTELVGRAVVAREDMEYAFSNHLTRIRVDESKVTPEWVAYCINTLWKQGYFARICKQWVGQSGVNQDVLKKEVAIPVPPIEEQRKIVEILDRLLEKEFEIEDCSNIDRSIGVIKKSILAKAFRGELGSNDLDEESIKSLLD